MSENRQAGKGGCTLAISLAEFERRYAAIRESMGTDNLDCLLVYGLPDDFNRGNVRYITGSGRGGCCVFPPEGNPVLLAGINQSRSAKLRKTVGAFDILDIKDTDDNVRKVVEELSRFYNRGLIGVAGIGCMPVPMYLAVKERFGDRLVDAGIILERLREIKSPEEIEQIRQAASVADSVYAMLRNTVRPGLSEFEIYAAVKRTVYEAGCEYSFDLIDAAGATMNMSFYPTGDRLEAGGTLFMEITPACDGYYAQLPVTLPVTGYPPHVKKMVNAWARADEVARKVLKPGTRVSDLYRVLIEAVRENGFISPYRPGHAIGLDALDFWSITGDSDRVLKEGMVIAVHPSVMLEIGGDGCGMGYTYLITGEGAERMSKVDLADELLGKGS